MRAIDISGQAPVGGVQAGAVAELRWLAIADLVIDDRFQRPLKPDSWRAIRRIAEAFAWGKFAPVVASPVVGGKYSLIDGQHRTHAAALCGFEMVPAMVVVLSPSDQASSFAAINGNVTAITAFHVYKAALAAGEGWAIAARDAVAEGGCQLMTYHPSAVNKRPREVYCIQTVRRYVGQGRADVIRAGLSALAALPGATAEHFTNGILDAWFGALLAGGGRAMQADLAGFVAAHDLVRTRDGIVQVSRQPEFRGSSIRDLTQSAYGKLLDRFIGSQNLPVPVAGDEGAMGARMAALAKAEGKAHRRAGMA